MRPRGVGGGGAAAGGRRALHSIPLALYPSIPLAHLPLGHDLSRYSLKRRAYLQVKSREINVAARLLNRPGHLKCTINMDDLILILGTIQGATGMLVKHGFIRTLVYLFIYEHVCKSIVYNYTPVRSLTWERASLPWVLKTSHRKNREF